MNESKKPYSYPIRLTFQPQMCHYCENKNTGTILVEHLFGIMYCDEHKGVATRDINAWLAAEKIIRLSDVSDDPLFIEGGLLERDLCVRRSNGVIDTLGWKLHKHTHFDPAFILYDLADGWWIKAYNEDIDRKRGLRIKDLKLSLPEEQHFLVDLFIVRLENGLYNSELVAFNEAVEQWKKVTSEAENPSTTIQKEAKSSPIVDIYAHGIGFGRMFIPPSDIGNETNLPEEVVELSKETGADPIEP